MHENFRIFHLVDEKLREIDFHYHDFHKIMIFRKGNASYCVEGRTYELKLNDIVFVPAGEVHRPILHDDSVYERIIIYISREYLDSFREKDADLSLCLKRAHENQSHVLRVKALPSTRLGRVIAELEQSFSPSEYANELYHEVLFLEFMIQLNRAALRNGIAYIADSASNEKILRILNYLGEHLTEDIRIDDLAESFHLNRYHLMHIFKEETGYSIGNYITGKRLFLARTLIDEGMPVTDACYASGFRNYTTFFRAYKKAFNSMPSAGRDRI